MSFKNFLTAFDNISSFNSFYNFVWNRIASALEHIFYFALVYSFVCLSFYKLIFLCAERISRRPTPGRRFNILRLLDLVKFEKLKWPNKFSMNRVVVIVSHPDDECMFFGPIIHSLVKHFGSKLYLLCLSHGNYEKQVSDIELYL